MALKSAIHHSVVAAAVAERAPRELREYVHVNRLTLPLYTVISYPGMRGQSSSVVTSKSISRALAQTAMCGEPLVAIAHNFTAEALALLEEHGAIVFRRRDFFWSDESYEAIR